MADLPIVEIFMTPDEGPKRLEEMTREQLIYAVRLLGTELRDLHKTACLRRALLFERLTK